MICFILWLAKGSQVCNQNCQQYKQISTCECKTCYQPYILNESNCTYPIPNILRNNFSILSVVSVVDKNTSSFKLQLHIDESRLNKITLELTRADLFYDKWQKVYDFTQDDKSIVFKYIGDTISKRHPYKLKFQLINHSENYIVISKTYYQKHTLQASETTNFEILFATFSIILAIFPLTADFTPVMVSSQVLFIYFLENSRMSYGMSKTLPGNQYSQYLFQYDWYQTTQDNQYFTSFNVLWIVFGCATILLLILRIVHIALYGMEAEDQWWHLFFINKCHPKYILPKLLLKIYRSTILPITYNTIFAFNRCKGLQAAISIFILLLATYLLHFRTFLFYSEVLYMCSCIIAVLLIVVGCILYGVFIPVLGTLFISIRTYYKSWQQKAIAILVTLGCESTIFIAWINVPHGQYLFCRLAAVGISFLLPVVLTIITHPAYRRLHY